MKVPIAYWRAVTRWWTLENWTRAADLAFKLGGILAALAAVGFLQLKPHVTVRGPFPLGSIDVEALASAYAPDPVPTAVADAARRYNLNLPPVLFPYGLRQTL